MARPLLAIAWLKLHDYELNPSGRRHPSYDLDDLDLVLYHLQGKWRRLLAIIP